MYFVGVNQENLSDLRNTFELIDQIDPEEVPKLYLYGLASDGDLINDAKEAVVASNDTEDLSLEQVEMSSLAVVVPLSADVVFYLTGSGLKLQKEEFSYIGGSEGVQSSSFNWAHVKPKVTVGSFSSMALASSPVWADKFLQQYAQKAPAPAPAPRQVERTEAVPTQPQVPPVKSSSLKTANMVVICDGGGLDFASDNEALAAREKIEAAPGDASFFVFTGEMGEEYAILFTSQDELFQAAQYVLQKLGSKEPLQQSGQINIFTRAQMLELITNEGIV